jgi:hypothetical protein
MKSARESATQIESPSIRVALAAELRRLPVDDSSSALVKRVHADFLADLEEGNGNPSPNPSRKGSGNPSLCPDGDPSRQGSAEGNGNGPADPPANPVQGKGEGYGPVPLDSPLPSSPPPTPRARAKGAASPGTPLLNLVEAKSGEGEISRPEEPQNEPASLTDELRAIRPDWTRRQIENVLADPSVLERPPSLVRTAALICARDRETRLPARLLQDGPWWSQARTDVAQSSAPGRAPWCGQRECDPVTRRIGEHDPAIDRPRPCPRCGRGQAVAS